MPASCDEIFQQFLDLLKILPSWLLYLVSV